MMEWRKPENDGACDHLPGMQIPEVLLTDTRGSVVDLAGLSLTVLYVHPMIGQPGRALPQGWDSIPGARGCTPQSCAFRDNQSELNELGARVFGISTQESFEQAEARQRLALPFELLSDPECVLYERLGLPTFEAEGKVFYRRATLIVLRGRVLACFYPIARPEENAGEVVQWLAQRVS